MLNPKYAANNLSFFWSISKRSKRANRGRDLYSNKIHSFTASALQSSDNAVTACGWNLELGKNPDGIRDAGNGNPATHSSFVRDGPGAASALLGRGLTLALTLLLLSVFCLLAES